MTNDKEAVEVLAARVAKMLPGMAPSGHIGQAKLILRDLTQAGLLDPGWSSDMKAAPRDGTEVRAYREDAGGFVAQYGAMDIFAMSDMEIDDIDPDVFWQEDWWTNTPDGAFRLDGDLVPTHWKPLGPLPLVEEPTK